MNKKKKEIKKINEVCDIKEKIDRMRVKGSNR